VDLSFPVYRAKSIRHYARKTREPGIIYEDLKLRDKTKHQVLLCLGLVDETKEVTEDWVRRGIAAAQESWGKP
jgi:hypothetical protein